MLEVYINSTLCFSAWPHADVDNNNKVNVLVLFTQNELNETDVAIRDKKRETYKMEFVEIHRHESNGRRVFNSQ